MTSLRTEPTIPSIESIIGAASLNHQTIGASATTSSSTYIRIENFTSYTSTLQTENSDIPKKEPHRHQTDELFLTKHMATKSHANPKWSHVHVYIDNSRIKKNIYRRVLRVENRHRVIAKG